MTRVLIVDDHEENLTLLRAMLEYHGFQVDAAWDGAEALLKARQSPPLLVISDLLMPVMDGYTLLRHWKADQRLRQIPFVVYTATYTDPKDQQLAFDLGVDAFILKPVARAAFMAQIEAVLAQQRHGELVPAAPPVVSEPILLKEYNAVLVRKLETKTEDLERANRALRDDIVRREQAEAEAGRLLEEVTRSRASLLSLLEERREVEAALREREETFRLVTETIDEVFWMADIGIKTLLYISPGYERVWGRTRASLHENPRSFLDAVHPDDLDRLLAALAIDETGQQYECEYRIIRPDGSLRWIWDRGYPVRDETGKATGYAGVAQDITERKQAEELLRERDSQLQTIVENLTEGLVVSDLDGRLLHSNRAALDLHGYAAKDEWRRRLPEFADTFELAAMDGTVWPVAQWPLARILRGEKLRNLEVRIRHLHAGWRKVLNYGGTLVRDDAGRPLMAIFTISDITERKQAEEALGESRVRLEALTRRLLDVQEAERRLIASELHDEVGGVLTAVKLNLQALRRGRTAEQGEAALVDGLALVDGAIQSVRSLSLDLRPAVLDDLGLIPALKWYCGRQAQRAGVAIELALDAIDLKAAPQLESACFRIVQEAVTNALRHAGARRIQVTLHREDERFAIEIADDGGGFDPAAARKRGLAGENGGLLGMEERAELLGGRFGIDSAPGAGARVRAEFAMPEDRVA